MADRPVSAGRHRPQPTALQGVIGSGATPRRGKTVPELQSAAWLAKPAQEVVKTEVSPTRKASHRARIAEAMDRDVEGQESSTQRRSARPGSAPQSRVGRFALTEGTATCVRPGTARGPRPSSKIPGARPATSWDCNARGSLDDDECPAAVHSSPAKAWYDQITAAPPSPEDAAAKERRRESTRGFCIGDLFKKKTLRERMDNEGGDIQERRVVKEPSGKDRAQTARTVTMLKQTMGARDAGEARERANSADEEWAEFLGDALPDAPGTRVYKKSLFQTSLLSDEQRRKINPRAYGLPQRPQSGRSRNDLVDVALELKTFEADAAGTPKTASLPVSPVRPTSAIVKEGLMKDALRLEKVYSCQPHTEIMDVYAGLSTASPSPELGFGDSRPSSPTPLRAGSPEIPAPQRPKTPLLQSDEEFEQPRPPEHLESAGHYHKATGKVVLIPPYRPGTLPPEEHVPPKFSVDTVREFFDSVLRVSAKYDAVEGGQTVTRRQLLFALNENEDIFNVFCAVDIYKDRLETAQGISGGVTLPGSPSKASAKRYTQSSFAKRVAMMRRALELLDRLDFEWQSKVKKNASARRRSLSQGSLSRNFNFEVFVTYFKYQDMLLEYKSNEELNWNWKRGNRSKSQIFRDCEMEEFQQTALNALSTPNHPDVYDPLAGDDDDSDEEDAHALELYPELANTATAGSY